MIEFAKEEISELTSTLDKQGEALQVLLLPRDPLDDKNIMLEIRAGKFLADLLLLWLLGGQ